jgi:hypothetical protein
MLVTEKAEFYTTSKRLKTEVKMFPKSIRGQVVYSILCILIMLKWLDLHHLLPRKAEEKVEILNSRAKLENESLCPNRITIQMKEIQPRDSIWFPELYLTMKVCTSSAERAEFVNPHITVTTENLPPPWMEEFLQTILCRQNRAAIYSYASNPQGLSSTQPGAIWDQSTDRKAETKSTS